MARFLGGSSGSVRTPLVHNGGEPNLLVDPDQVRVRERLES